MVYLWNISSGDGDGFDEALPEEYLCQLAGANSGRMGNEQRKENDKN